MIMRAAMIVPVPVIVPMIVPVKTMGWRAVAGMGTQRACGNGFMPILMPVSVIVRMPVRTSVPLAHAWPPEPPVPTSTYRAWPRKATDA
jgi:hypothetical protein